MYSCMCVVVVVVAAEVCNHRDCFTFTIPETTEPVHSSTYNHLLDAQPICDSCN